MQGHTLFMSSMLVFNCLIEYLTVLLGNLTVLIKSINLFDTVDEILEYEN